jgi:hypothetical protein
MHLEHGAQIHTLTDYIRQRIILAVSYVPRQRITPITLVVKTFSGVGMNQAYLMTQI